MSEQLSRSELRLHVTQALRRTGAQVDSRCGHVIDALVEDVRRYCDGEKIIDASGGLSIKLTLPSSLPEPVEHRLMERIRTLQMENKMGLIEKIVQEPALEPIGKVFQRIAKKAALQTNGLPGGEAVANGASEMYRTAFLLNIKRYIRRTIPTYDSYYFHAALRTLSIEMVFHSGGGFIQPELLSRATLTAAATKLQGMPEVCFKKCVAAVFPQAEKFRALLHDLRAGKFEKWIYHTTGKDETITATDAGALKDYLMKALMPPGGGPHDAAARTTIQQSCALLLEETGKAAEARWELAKTCEKHDVSTGKTTEEMGDDMRTMAGHFPEEMTAVFHEIFDKTAAAAWELYAALDEKLAFARDPLPASKLYEVPTGDDHLEIHSYVRSILMIRGAAMNTMSTQKRDRALRPIILSDICERMVAASAAHSLLLSQLRRRYPWIFSLSDEEREGNNEERANAIARKEQWINFVLTILRSMQQGLAPLPKLVREALEPLFEEQADALEDFKRLHATSLERRVVDVRDRQPVDVPANTPPATHAVHHRIEKENGDIDSYTFTTEFRRGLEAEVHRSFQDKNVSYTAEAWIWKAGGEPCHSSSTMIPLSRLHPEGDPAVRTLRNMGAGSDNDLNALLDGCRAMRFDTRFGILCEEQRPIKMFSLVAKDKEGKTGSVSSFLLTQEQARLLLPPVLAEKIVEMPGANFELLGMPKDFGAGTFALPYRTEGKLLDAQEEDEEESDEEVPALMETNGALVELQQVKDIMRPLRVPNLLPLARADNILKAAKVKRQESKDRSEHFHCVGPRGTCSVPTQPIKDGEIHRKHIYIIIAKVGDIGALQSFVTSRLARLVRNRNKKSAEQPTAESNGRTRSERLQ